MYYSTSYFIDRAGQDYINAIIPIRAVLSLVGIAVGQDGKCCLRPGDRNDKSFGSCHIFDDTNDLYDFALGQSYQAIDVVMAELGLEWHDACCYLIEAFNLQSEFADSAKNPNEVHQRQESSVIISTEEKETIHLMDHTFLTPEKISYQFQKGKKFDQTEDGGWIVTSLQPSGWSWLDDDGKRFVIQNCARNTMRKYELMRHLSYVVENRDLASVILEEEEKCFQIYQKFGGTLPTMMAAATL